MSWHRDLGGGPSGSYFTYSDMFWFCKREKKRIKKKKIKVSLVQLEARLRWLDDNRKKLTREKNDQRKKTCDGEVEKQRCVHGVKKNPLWGLLVCGKSYFFVCLSI